jgi:hypothetical protein
MASEARALAENPPQRHRDHGDDPVFTDERGFDLIFWALCVSVVKIRAKQSQFARGRMNTKSRLEHGLRENRWMTPPRKQSQFPGACRPRHEDLSCKTKPISGQGLALPRPRRCAETELALAAGRRIG